MVDVYLNEKFVGTVDSASEFVEDLRKQRRENKIPKELNVRYVEEFNEVYIDSIKGRLRRPLILVEEGVSKLKGEHI